MTVETEKRAIAFIRTVGNRCARCLHHNEENCRNCISRWANSILSDYERDETASNPAIDYSLYARMVMIVDKLQKAGRPLMADEIDVSDYCTRQLKLWTLRKMVAEGRIGRIAVREGMASPRYRYFLPNPRKGRRE